MHRYIPPRGRGHEELATEIKKLGQKMARMEKKLMSKAEEINAKVDELRQAFSDATDEVAADLERLRQEVQAGLTGGLTADQATALGTKLDEALAPIAARLTELGKDPVNPVPEPTE